MDHWHITSQQQLKHIERLSISIVTTAAAAKSSVKNNECGGTERGLSASCSQKDPKKTWK